MKKVLAMALILILGTFTLLSALPLPCSASDPEEVKEVSAQSRGGVGLTVIATPAGAFVMETAPDSRIENSYSASELTGSISGHVYQADGVTPIPHVGIAVFDWDNPGMTIAVVTDSSGYYEKTGLPSGQYGVLAVGGFAPGYANEFFNNTYVWSNATPVGVTAPYDTPDIDFMLDPAGSFSGYLYETDGVTPIPSPYVPVLVRDLDPSSGCLVDIYGLGDGHYTATGLPTGSYRAQACPSCSGLPYRDEWYDDATTIDGATTISVTSPGDTPGIDFVLADLVNTPTGAGVEVVTTLAAITFEHVTSPGETSLSQLNIGTPLPEDFMAACDPPIYYEISTTATYDGTIEICLSYYLTCNDNGLELLHYEDGNWVPITTSVDLDANIICGEVTSLSEFALAIPSEIASVQVAVGLQGSSRPDPSGWEIPVTVKFFAPGANVLNDAPVYEFDLVTTKSGDTAVCQTSGIAPGTYGITVASEHTLMNVKKNVVITAPSTSVDMGTLLEGDWNGNLTIDWEDLGTILLTYDKCQDVQGYDPQADFNRNGCIDWEDLGLVLINYDKTSPVEVG